MRDDDSQYGFFSGGNAGPHDRSMFCRSVAVDEEIVDWLAHREAKRRVLSSQTESNALALGMKPSVCKKRWRDPRGFTVDAKAATSSPKS